MTTLVLVDDHIIFRDALKALLAVDGGMSVVAEADNARDAAAAVTHHDPDVVVVDVSLPGESGLWLARTLSRQRRRARLLGLSMHAGAEHAEAAFAAGMQGYATKNQTPAEVLCAIRTVAQGHRYVAPGLDVPSTDAPPARSRLALLTVREREIFDLTVEGFSNVDIARKLSISRRTVETHRSRVLHKLRARNTMDVLHVAHRLGLLPATRRV